MIKLYFHQTPNSMKVALYLEETGLPYQLIPIDTLKGEQHTAEFRAINPNGKTPAIEDDGIPFNPFTQESPDTSLSLEDREIGGLGIHIVKSLMDSYEYIRIDNRNVLKLVKNNI